MDVKNIRTMDRRSFIKVSGAAAAGAALAGCAPRRQDKAARTEEILSRGAESMPQNYPGVGLLGFGCMRWPMIEETGEIDQEAVNEMVDYALAHGVNYFDSAPVYLRGKSELATATALLRHPREEYIISTKCSTMRTDGSLETGKQMYLQSLENYQTDYLDYYLLHNINSYESFKKRFLDNGLMDYLQGEKKKGHIRNLGFSFHGSKEGFDELMALHEKYHWDFVLIQMNYHDWTHASRDAKAKYMYNRLAELDIPVVIMEPLLGGRLASIPGPLADMLKELKPQSSIASWAFRFNGSFPKVLTVLSGMTCMDHLRDNLETYLDFEKLSEEEFALLEKIAGEMDKYPLVRCTACQYCMPCPYGINIPAIFKFYNDNINAGTFVVSSEQKGYARQRASYLARYGKAIPTLRQADHCIGCKECLVKCPQHIDIPSELHRIDRYIEKLKKDAI